MLDNISRYFPTSPHTRPESQLNLFFLPWQMLQLQNTWPCWQCLEFWRTHKPCVLPFPAWQLRCSDPWCPTPGIVCCPAQKTKRSQLATATSTFLVGNKAHFVSNYPASPLGRNWSAAKGMSSLKYFVCRQILTTCLVLLQTILTTMHHSTGKCQAHTTEGLLRQSQSQSLTFDIGRPGLSAIVDYPDLKHGVCYGHIMNCTDVQYLKTAQVQIVHLVKSPNKVMEP